MLQATKKMLWNDENKEALKYLIEERRLSEETIKEFEFGYCPEWVEDYRLAGKIILPIFDSYGELVAVSTRVPYTKKFWHESFYKGIYLYGLHIAKQSIIENKSTIVVEGEFDVASLHSFGIKNIVGCLGSTLGMIQIAMLARYCEDIYILFDGDPEGKASINRIIKDIVGKEIPQFSKKPKSINIIPVYLPESLDPDDFVFKYGKEKLIELLNNSKELMSENLFRFS